MQRFKTIEGKDNECYVEDSSIQRGLCSSAKEPTHNNCKIKQDSAISLSSDGQCLRKDVMTFKHVTSSQDNEILDEHETNQNKLENLEVVQDHSHNTTNPEECMVTEGNPKDRAGERMGSYSDPNFPTLSRSPDDHKLSKRRWVILAASFITLAIAVGFPFNMSVLYVEFLLEFGKSKAMTSLVQSVAAGVYFISGCFGGITINRFGTRRVGIPATILASIGVGLSYFATGIEFLIVFLSIFSGIGLSLTYIGALNSISEYFEGRSRVLALSFAVFGSGVGSVIFPFVLDVLIKNYGWRGCLLITSGIILNLVPCLAVCKPRCPVTKTDNLKRTPTSQQDRNQRNKMLQNRLRGLRRKKIYVINTFALAVTLAFLNAVLFMFIDFLIFNGFTRDEAVFLYFSMNLTSTFFRMIPGICKQVPHMSTLAIPIFYSGLGSVSLFLFPFVTHYSEYVIVICVYGISLGGMICLLPMSNMRILGYRDYSTGFGMCLTVIGIINTASGPIVGFIRDVSGSYDKAFFVCGACTGFGCILFSSALCLKVINGLEKDPSLDIEFKIESNKSGQRSSIFPWKKRFDVVS